MRTETKWPFVVPGIPDHWFMRGASPMTKQEVRTVTLSKLRLSRESVVWDIGSGTGSIAVEAARLAPAGKVYAVERSPQGAELIEANRRLFELENLVVVKGTAPPVLAGLPSPDRVVIGGSGGELGPILDLVKKRLVPGGLVVVNCATVETLYGALHLLGKMGFQSVEGVGVTVTRLVETSHYHRFESANPVFILSGEQPAAEGEACAAAMERG